MIRHIKFTMLRNSNTTQRFCMTFRKSELFSKRFQFKNVNRSMGQKAPYWCEMKLTNIGIRTISSQNYIWCKNGVLINSHF